MKGPQPPPMPEIPQDLKSQEREILIALGWRPVRFPSGRDRNYWHEPNCAVEYHHEDDECNGNGGMPFLVDPGTFWPMFEAWCVESKTQYTLRRHLWRNDGFVVYQASIQCPEESVHGESRKNQTEAGIKAWHAALVALGKIKA